MRSQPKVLISQDEVTTAIILLHAVGASPTGLWGLCRRMKSLTHARLPDRNDGRSSCAVVPTSGMAGALAGTLWRERIEDPSAI